MTLILRPCCKTWANPAKKRPAPEPDVDDAADDDGLEGPRRPRNAETERTSIIRERGVQLLAEWGCRKYVNRMFYQFSDVLWYEDIHVTYEKVRTFCGLSVVSVCTKNHKSQFTCVYL